MTLSCRDSLLIAWLPPTITGQRLILALPLAINEKHLCLFQAFQQSSKRSKHHLCTDCSHRKCHGSRNAPWFPNKNQKLFTAAVVTTIIRSGALLSRIIISYWQWVHLAKL
ncbi:hypothetical protein XELAEV_18017298mg [Xenopus laevis]|uniref:Uncharacterized protein n=1 Tax=Xenopus laevis TaxID=8355 RepID=A0A974HSA4_XENLA|nr:hypothetical protein XELAEV_18017298mg [Xenopus laevis]